jgi:hypothetical protein
MEAASQILQTKNIGEKEQNSEAKVTKVYKTTV